MESNPGNPAPDLTTLWWIILTQYGVIIGTITLFIFLLWLVTWFRDRAKKRRSSSSDLWVHNLAPLTANEIRELSGLPRNDDWFSDKGQEELYRDFSPN